MVRHDGRRAVVVGVDGSEQALHAVRGGGAELVVVGPRRRGQLPGPVLGSDGNALAYPAGCPVPVVRPAGGGDRDAV
jgi:hypothetical protein